MHPPATMLHTLALYVGYAVLGTGAVLAPAALLAATWWWAWGKVVDQVWTLKVFYETCARILNERKAADRNQLTAWPPSDSRYVD